MRAVLGPDHRGEGKSFGSEVEPPEDATEVERFIAFMGRDPRP